VVATAAARGLLIGEVDGAFRSAFGRGGEQQRVGRAD